MDRRGADWGAEEKEEEEGSKGEEESGQLTPVPPKARESAKESAVRSGPAVRGRPSVQLGPRVWPSIPPPPMVPVGISYTITIPLGGFELTPGASDMEITGGGSWGAQA